MLVRSILTVCLKAVGKVAEEKYRDRAFVSLVGFLEPCFVEIDVWKVFDELVLGDENRNAVAPHAPLFSIGTVSLILLDRLLLFQDTNIESSNTEGRSPLARALAL